MMASSRPAGSLSPTSSQIFFIDLKATTEKHMPDNSFDIVSTVDFAEVGNAVQQARKEVATRYDLKGSGSTIELNDKESKLVLASSDDYKLKAVADVLEQKLVKRKVPLKALTYGTVEEAAGSTVRQEISIQNGISVEKCREIVKAIKQSKLKVQSSIQGDLVRVTGKSRDALQEVMEVVRTGDFGVHLQFTNRRTN
jgi:hypothetical protein